MLFALLHRRPGPSARSASGSRSCEYLWIHRPPRARSNWLHSHPRIFCSWFVLVRAPS